MADNKLLGASGLYYGSNEIIKAYMGSNLVWEKGIDYSKEYFCIEALENCNVTFTPFNPIQIIYYITDEEITSNEIYNGIQNGTLSYGSFNADSTTTSSFVSLTTGKKLYIIGDKENIGGSTNNRNVFSFSGRVNLLGNIMSLSHGMTSNSHVLTIPSELPNKNFDSSYTYQFGRLFHSNSTIEDTGNLILPATTLVDYCYYQMFGECTGLTTAPELPATTLAEYCYNSMFEGCTGLTSAPSSLPATTLAESCYYLMFMNCSSLTTAPELPATTLVNSCYTLMFYGCTSLNYIKAMFTTAPSGWTYTGSWVQRVSATGTFVKNSEATWDVTGNNGIPSGWTVQTASS